MDSRVKRAILERRIEGLKGHIRTVGETPGMKRELEKAEAELAALEQPKSG